MIKILKHRTYAIGTVFTCIFNEEEVSIDGVCFKDSYNSSSYDNFFREMKFEILGEELNENNFINRYSLDDFRKVQSELFNYYGEILMPEYDYLEYHYTGSIEDDAYDGYIVDYSIKDYQRLIATFLDKKGEKISLRGSNEKLKYVKHDENGDILRDKEGLAIYLSDEEMKEKNLNIYNTSIVAFNEKEESVGLASDEFGADGIWVNKDYQRRGIGVELLKYFREQFPEDRKIGQMTSQGMDLVSAYFHKYVKED